MTKVSIMPELSEREQLELTRFLIDVLSNEQLESSIRKADLGLSDGKLILYVDGTALRVRLGKYWSWEIDSTHVYVGAHAGGYIEMARRLPIVLGLMQYVGPNDRLSELASAAIARYLLSEMNQLRSALVVSEPAASGIAFSESQCAALVDGVWMLPSGEEVDVSGSEWTVCSGVVPQSPVVEPVVALDIETPAIDANFSATGRTAFPPTTTTEFRVGQRVRFTHIPGRGGSSEPGEGVITRFGDDDPPNRLVYLRVDGLEDPPAVNSSRLSAIESPTTEPRFQVGDRVRYSAIARTSYPAGEGIIAERPDGASLTNSDGEYYVLADSPHSHWNIAESALEHLFEVGQRVRYSRIPGVSETAGEGVLTDFFAGSDTRLDDERGNNWAVRNEDLTPIRSN